MTGKVFAPAIDFCWLGPFCAVTYAELWVFFNWEIKGRLSADLEIRKFLDFQCNTWKLFEMPTCSFKLTSRTNYGMNLKFTTLHDTNGHWRSYEYNRYLSPIVLRHVDSLIFLSHGIPDYFFLSSISILFCYLIQGEFEVHENILTSVLFKKIC